MEAVVEQSEGLVRSQISHPAARRRSRRTDAHLEDMPPILALVIEPLVQHLHDLDKLVSARSTSAPPVPDVLMGDIITHWLYVICAISFICVPDGPHASLDVASRTLVCARV